MGKFKTITIFITLLLTNYGSAKEIDNPLKIGIGARAIGLGGAYTALSDDLSAIYWNPAGLVNINLAQIYMMKNSWQADVNQSFLAFSQLIEPRRFSFGSSINYLHQPGVKDLLISLAYAGQLRNNLSLGVGVTSIQQMVNNQKARGIKGDLGLLFRPSKNLVWGVCLQNLGQEMDFIKVIYSLPRTLKTGLAYLKDNSLISLDTELPKGNNPALMIGLERWLIKQIAVRCGWRYQKHNSTGLSLGLGLRAANLQLDYGWRPDKDSKDNHRLSLMINFKGAPTCRSQFGLQAGYVQETGTKTEEVIREEPVKQEELSTLIPHLQTKEIDIKEPLKAESLSEIDVAKAAARQGEEKPIKKESVRIAVQRERLPALPPLIKEEALMKKETGLKKIEEKRIYRVLKTTQEANIYTGPAAIHPLLTTIKEATILTLLDDSNQWYYKVKLQDGRTGWVSYLYVE